MPSAYVVFDTNIYRSLSDADFRRIQTLERQSSVVALTSAGVILELLARIAEPSSQAFLPSWRALRRLAVHCTSYDGSKLVLRTVLTLRQQIHAAVHGANSPDVQEEYDLLGQIVGAVVESANPDDLEYLRPVLDLARNIVSAREKQFQDALFDGIVRTVVPHAERWDAIARDGVARRAALESLGRVDLVRLAAEVLVDGIANDNGGTNTALRSELIDGLVANFRVPLALHGRVILSIVRDGRDMNASRNTNTIWDIEIAGAVSASVKIRRTPSLLVTADNFILQAADDLNVSAAFLSLKSYEAHLESRAFLS